MEHIVLIQINWGFILFILFVIGYMMHGTFTQDKDKKEQSYLREMEHAIKDQRRALKKELAKIRQSLKDM
jgi:hypothetical protein